jgi:hypothetical protein
MVSGLFYITTADDEDDTDEVMVKQKSADMIVKKEDDNADNRNPDLPSIDDITKYRYDRR